MANEPHQDDKMKAEGRKKNKKLAQVTIGRFQETSRPCGKSEGIQERLVAMIVIVAYNTGPFIHGRRYRQELAGVGRGWQEPYDRPNLAATLRR